MHARAAEMGVVMTPQHGTTSDAELASYLVAQLDPTAAGLLVERLLGTEGVDAAYAKPAGEPPGREQ